MAQVMKLFFIDFSMFIHAASESKIPSANVSQVLLPKELPRQGHTKSVSALSSCVFPCIGMPKRFGLKWAIHACSQTHPDEVIWQDTLSNWAPVAECAQHGPLRRQGTLAEVSYLIEMPQLGQPKCLQMNSDSSSPSGGSFAPVHNCFHIIICGFAVPWAHRYFLLCILSMTSKICIHLAHCNFYLFLALL